jgi:hypothetical protein
MRNIPMGAALLLILGAFGMPASALSQTSPQGPVAIAPKLNLTLEQRHVIREIIKDMKTEPAPAEVKPAVGDTIPADIKVQAMPDQVAKKVPQIKTHEFFVADGQIFIVDPKDNRVAEVIKLTPE